MTDFKRLKELAGVTEADYSEPKANHPVKSGGEDVKGTLGHKHQKPATSTKTGDHSANYNKEAGGKVVKNSNEMDQHHKAGGKGHTDEPKANHKVKTGGKEVHVKEMAQAIAQSGDMEGTLAALIQELQEQGLEL